MSAEQIKHADRLAKEMAREQAAEGRGANMHVAEERGFSVDDSGLTEEDR